MDFIGSVLGFCFVPFIIWWTLSWWIIIPSSILFVISIGVMSPGYKDDYPVAAFICLMIAFALNAIGVSFVSEVTGFWPSTLEGVKFFVKYISVYIACGIATLLPLWFVNVRRIGKEIKQYFQHFIIDALAASASDTRNLGRVLTAAEKREVEEQNGVWNGALMTCLQDMYANYKKFHSDPPSIKINDNMGLISSLIFLWPIHIIIEIFGEFIAKIPEHVASLLRFPLNLISRLSVRGLPEELK